MHASMKCNILGLSVLLIWFVCYSWNIRGCVKGGEVNLKRSVLGFVARLRR